MVRGKQTTRPARDEPVSMYADVVSVLDASLTYARERDYTGWDYGDGMSSRIRQWLPVDNKYLNIAFQEIAKRPPVNVRPLLLVEQRRNYKGAALFAMANRNRERLAAVSGDDPAVDHVAEARRLNDWLVANRSTGFSGFCGGHKHPIQHLRGGIGRPNDPDIVSTSFAVAALLDSADLDAVYPALARTATDFIVDDLDYRAAARGAKINYHLNHDPNHFTINAGALGARLFTDLYDRFGGNDLRERATAILDHVAGLQTDLGGWAYRDPPSSSHLSMDNHHNGFVIEAFQRYHEVFDTERYADTLSRALEFYREVLFERSGAPNWDETDRYPKDVHAAAQGILVFTYAGDLEFARRIVEWTLDELYAGDGRFYYRKYRLLTSRTTLMRWCQAWMSYALSEYALARAA